MKRITLFLNQNSVWTKVIFFSTTIFFIFFADAILSFWAPNLLDEKIGAVGMGVIMAVSSLVGLIADLILPALFARVSAKKLIILAVVSSVIFAGLLILGVSWPMILIFVTSMAVWGLYYEFIIFANQLFVAGSVPYTIHSGAWAIISVFRSLAYLLGPIASGYLISKNSIYPGVGAIVMALFGFTAIFAVRKSVDQPIQVELKNINVLAESKKWVTLLTSVWPLILISLVLGFVDSVFWTTGALMDGSILFLYQLPSLFIGFIVVKWGIYKGKKKLAESFMLLSGLFLALFAYSEGLRTIQILVFVSSIFSAFTYPLIEGVYSDIVGRMGREKRHLIGFSSAAISVAYIIGPIVAGFITEKAGETMTFSYLGVFVMTASIILLFITPRKILLPQEEIRKW